MILSFLLLSFSLEVNAFLTNSNAQATSVYVNNFDWDDQWGWCKAEDKRKELGKVGGGQKGCLRACEKEKWNGKYPRGCEYSGPYGTCNVFFGRNVRSAQAGSSYRCAINIAPGVNFAETEVGRIDSTCYEQCAEKSKEMERGRIVCGRTCQATCRGQCYRGALSGGGLAETATGAVDESCFDLCEPWYWKANPDKDYHNDYWTMSDFCDAACNYLPDSESLTASVQQVAGSATSADEIAVYGFAAIGVAALVAAAWRKLRTKPSYAPAPTTTATEEL